MNQQPIIKVGTRIGESTVTQITREGVIAKDVGGLYTIDRNVVEAIWAASPEMIVTEVNDDEPN